jgi:hypothetical protein
VQRPAIKDSPGDPVKNRSEDFHSPFAALVAGLGLTKPWGLRHVSPASPVTHRACGASLVGAGLLSPDVTPRPGP